MNDISKYKNPYCRQYVAPYGFCFYKDGIRLGKIIWVSNTEGIYVEKEKDYYY